MADQSDTSGQPERLPCTCSTWAPDRLCPRHEALGKIMLRGMDPNRPFETEDDPRFKDDD